jgi:hypothetical protein
MAGNNYRIYLESLLDTSKVEAQIKALSSKSVLQLRTTFDKTDMDKFNRALEDIKTRAASIGKISLFGDQETGNIRRAVIEYKDALGNVVKEYVSINNEAKVNQVYVEDVARDHQEINRILEKRLGLSKKQTDEMERAAHQADLFLAKSKNLASTDSVRAATSKAQEIKVAVVEGDIAKVRKLRDEFALLKASLQTGRTGLDSWSEGMRNAIKQTIEYATSIGLVYGALNQLKQGIGYIKELNKELTNIQIVTGFDDSAISDLSMQYNGLAKEIGATTLEVTKGSLEWFLN